MRKNITLGIIASLLALSGLSINAMKMTRKRDRRLARPFKKNYTEAIQSIIEKQGKNGSCPGIVVPEENKKDKLNFYYNEYFIKTLYKNNGYGRKLAFPNNKCGKSLEKLKIKFDKKLKPLIDKEIDLLKTKKPFEKAIYKIQTLSTEEIKKEKNLKNILREFEKIIRKEVKRNLFETKKEIEKNMKERITNEVEEELRKKSVF